MKDKMFVLKLKKLRKFKKGLFFTIDALMAALILISGLLLMTSSYTAEQPRNLMDHLSKDFIGVLDNMYVYELNNSYVDELISNGTISNVNNTLIMQIGEFWSENKLIIANDFISNITSGLFPETMGYSVIINNETLFSKSNPVTSSLISAKSIISGIEKSKPIKGFVAKARAVSVDKTTTEIISFSPEGAGWYGSDSNKGFVYITKYFNISENSVINNATLYVSLHIEDDYSDWNLININNGACILTRDNMTFQSGEEGLFDIHDVSSCISPGVNNINLTLWNAGYNGHIHPGMHLAINYNLSENVGFISSDHSERIYFDNIVSEEANGDGSGAWQMVPFHIPTGAQDLSATLYLNLQEVNDLKDRRWWNYVDAWDFQIYVNDDDHFYEHPEGASDDINDCLYYSAACGNEYNWTGSFDITSELIDGTNVVSVYVNNYGDTVGGDGLTVIYSDPINDSENSSYIEFNYTLQPQVPYGVVELRIVEEYGGSPNPTKDVSFLFPSEAVAISSVFTHIVEQYSYISRVYGDTGYVPGNMVFESPSPRAVPTDVYISRNYLDVSELTTNYARIDETSNNDVLPESTIDYGYYVPSFVGYGDVFSTINAANSDAFDRLQLVMGSSINVSSFVLDNTSMSDVPSMWGPAIVEVRVWD